MNLRFTSAWPAELARDLEDAAQECGPRVAPGPRVGPPPIHKRCPGGVGIAPGGCGFAFFTGQRSGREVRLGRVHVDGEQFFKMMDKVVKVLRSAIGDVEIVDYH